MTSETPMIPNLQNLYSSGGLSDMFIDGLGWEAPSESVPPVVIHESIYYPQLASCLRGFRIYQVPCSERPTRTLMRDIDAQLRLLSPERMAVFEGPNEWFWYWPRHSSSGTTTYESIETRPALLPTFLAQRLCGLKFTASDHRNGITLTDVCNRVHGHFDASNVTAAFYRQFQVEHQHLSEVIFGIPESENTGYATTLLNRMMFIYFLQKKEFLNEDMNYLENTLAAVQEIRGRDHYYTFYRDALLPLFFNKLNDSDGVIKDPEILRILGDVPYVNGGIFGRTDLEEEFAEELSIPDEAFERILRFFSQFNWHLDTRPTGNDREINPEVIGYIFEQYINFAASGQRENGAYYTPHDVTSYMVAQTVIPRIMDNLSNLDHAFRLLITNPDRYIQPMMLHGWSEAGQCWEQVPEKLQIAWDGDPLTWVLLDDAEPDPLVNLPGETWVETFHRRERVEALRSRMSSGEIREVNDLITDNLNTQLLLTDFIDLMDDPSHLAELFDDLTGLSVFDPTCGSGAFLFAALEVLEDVYAHIIDNALGRGGEAVESLLTQVKAQPSSRYFIRKHIAIRNLYGTDLMPGAIETAKLRIFLSLAACVDTREELQPLPDLDFNLKAGNLVVGFKDAEDVYRVGGDLFTFTRLDDLVPRIDKYSELYSSFVESIELNDHSSVEIKDQLRRMEAELRTECNGIYAEICGFIDDGDTWVDQARPFHWFCEFPAIVQKGGFDVIIGNPPYIRMPRGSELQELSIGYETRNCPDFYAVCYERSLSLLHDFGRHAFVVMSNLAFGDDFLSLRALIARKGASEWWSTYGKIPQPLFDGVKVRNTILVLGPGCPLRMVTRHHIHASIQRPWLFPTIEFARSARLGDLWPIRGGVATSILEKIASLPNDTSQMGNEYLYLRNTGAYWFPVLLGPAPTLDMDFNVIEEVTSVLKPFRLHIDEVRRDVAAILGGKIGYLWWTAVGDDLNCWPRETIVPRALANVAKMSLGWQDAVSSVIKAAIENTIIVQNAGKNYFNIRWNNVRASTDTLDKLAFNSVGLNYLDWRRLNVLYRQMMRSSGDGRGHYVTTEEANKYLNWDV
ncbi:MAG: hypothetical protein LBG99_02400 [Propionibacteriaceae bacterium]|jgi:hypothetical protein|nr:hypothetical protein [Propionibacteriaceae bacterium]